MFCLRLGVRRIIATGVTLITLTALYILYAALPLGINRIEAGFTDIDEDYIDPVDGLIDRISGTLESAGSEGGYTRITDVFLSHSEPRDKYQITICTHSSLNYIKHIIRLAEVWDGPISLAVYSSHLVITLSILIHLHSCYPLVSSKVSFHIYFSGTVRILTRNEVRNVVFDANRDICGRSLADLMSKVEQDGVGEKGWYPVNVGRNVARVMARTHHVMVMDIELMPSSNLSSMFLHMTRDNSNSVHRLHEVLPPAPRVYVVPVFEVKQGVKIPRDKPSLLDLLNKSLALPFHKHICPLCHRILHYNKWVTVATHSQTMQIFFINKWLPPLWEPVFIGTKSDPAYDERFVGYGMNKIQQVYEMCKADYDFYILDNAFLIHTGIKKKTKSREWDEKHEQSRKNEMLFKSFMTSLDIKYKDVKTLSSCKSDNNKGVLGYFPYEILASNETT